MGPVAAPIEEIDIDNDELEVLDPVVPLTVPVTNFYAQYTLKEPVREENSPDDATPDTFLETETTVVQAVVMPETNVVTPPPPPNHEHIPQATNETTRESAGAIRSSKPHITTMFTGLVARSKITWAPPRTEVIGRAQANQQQQQQPQHRVHDGNDAGNIDPSIFRVVHENNDHDSRDGWIPQNQEAPNEEDNAVSPAKTSRYFRDSPQQTRTEKSNENPMQGEETQSTKRQRTIRSSDSLQKLNQATRTDETLVDLT